MNILKKSKLHTKLIIFALAIPLLIILGMHIGNTIFILYPNINLNPDGVGNAEWMSFLGSFLGGAFTLIALVYTIEYGKKTKQHELQLATIEKEERLLSEVIGSLNPLLINRLLTSIENLPLSPEHGYNKESVSAILGEIRTEQYRLYQHNVHLTFESNILTPCCPCTHNIDCTINVSKTEFKELFCKIHLAIHEGLNDCYEYLSKKDRAYTARLTVIDCERLLISDPTSQRVKSALQQAQAIIDSIDLDAETTKINELFTRVDALYMEDVSKLIYLGQKYISAKKINEENRLNDLYYFKFENPID